MKYLLCIALIFLKWSVSLSQSIIAGQVSANDSYTDINPDSVFQWTVSGPIYTLDSMGIDINNDDTIDFHLIFAAVAGVGATEYYLGVAPQNRNQVASGFITLQNQTWDCAVPDGPTQGDSVASFKENSIISANNTWGLSKGYCYHYDYYNFFYTKNCGLYIIDNWNNLGDRYVGVRVFSGRDTLYGWIRCTVSISDIDHGTISVLDYACNKSIVTGIKNIPSSSFKISPNPVKGLMNISYSITGNAVFELYDPLGQHLSSVNLSSDVSSKILDVRNLPGGIYEYTIKQQNTIVKSGTVAVMK